MKISKEVYKEKENILKGLNQNASFENISILVMRDEIDNIVNDLAVKQYTVQELLTFTQLFCLCAKERSISLKP